MTQDEKLDKIDRQLTELKHQTELLVSHIESEVGHSKARITELEEHKKRHEKWRFGENGTKGCISRFDSLESGARFRNWHLTGMWVFLIAAAAWLFWGLDLIWKRLP